MSRPANARRNCFVDTDLAKSPTSAFTAPLMPVPVRVPVRCADSAAVDKAFRLLPVRLDGVAADSPEQFLRHSPDLCAQTDEQDAPIFALGYTF